MRFQRIDGSLDRSTTRTSVVCLLAVLCACLMFVSVSASVFGYVSVFVSASVFVSHHVSVISNSIAFLSEWPLEVEFM